MKKILAPLLFLLAAQLPAQYPTYENCADLQDAHFQDEHIISKDNDPELEVVLKFDFYVDDEGNVNIYLIERQGRLKYYDAATGTVTMVSGTTAGVDQLDVKQQGEYGLVGIALDPDFATNKWIYLHYLANDPGSDMKVSRFTITSENKIDVASEKVLLQWTVRVSSHTGGDMVFDDMGNLLFTAGESHLVGGCYEPMCYHDESNTGRSVEQGVGNTADFRGSIVRIHPEDDGTYTIPEGNFAEFYSDYFENAGDATTAAEYADPDMVLPELYAKGLRNPYSLHHDPQTGWLTMGDCGSECRNYDGYDPDKHYCPPGAEGEEHNLITEPSFMGWPYFHGDNYPYAYEGEEQDPMTPINTSPLNTGVELLPPAVASTYPYPQSCSMTGPIYRYDPAVTTTGKLPPHFDGSWFAMDFVIGWIRTIDLDDTGGFESVSEDLFGDFQYPSPLKMRIGPDGIMYLINHNCSVYDHNRHDECTGIYKITYTGPDCEYIPAAVNPEKSDRGNSLKYHNYTFTGGIPGSSFNILDLQGKTILTSAFTSSGSASIQTKRNLFSRGVYMLVQSDPQGTLLPAEKFIIP